MNITRQRNVKGHTYIYDPVIVTDQEISEDTSFIQVPETDHVLHPMNGGWVHRFDVCSILKRDPVLLHKGKIQTITNKQIKTFTIHLKGSSDSHFPQVDMIL